METAKLNCKIDASRLLFSTLKSSLTVKFSIQYALLSLHHDFHSLNWVFYSIKKQTCLIIHVSHLISQLDLLNRSLYYIAHRWKTFCIAYYRMPSRFVCALPRYVESVNGTKSLLCGSDSNKFAPSHAYAEVKLLTISLPRCLAMVIWIACSRSSRFFLVCLSK